MAKRAAKRKSESALPTRKRKVQRASSPLSDENDEPGFEDSSSDELLSVDNHRVAARPAKKGKTRRSEPIHAADIYDEEEEHDGGDRTESQQFLALVQQESEKRKIAARATTVYLEGFTQRLGEDARALKAGRGELEGKMLEGDAGFIEAFTGAFKASRPMGSPASKEATGSPTIERGFAALYEKSLGVVQGARGVLEIFERLQQMTADIKNEGVGDVDWGEVDGTLMEVLDAGCIVGIQRSQGLLTARRPGPIDEDVARLAGPIYHEEDTEVLVGWGKMARRQGKATRKLTKTFGLG